MHTHMAIGEGGWQLWLTAASQTRSSYSFCIEVLTGLKYLIFLSQLSSHMQLLL